MCERESRFPFTLLEMVVVMVNPMCQFDLAEECPNKGRKKKSFPDVSVREFLEEISM